MKLNIGTMTMAIVVLGLMSLSIWGTVNDKSEYTAAQKFIELRNCKNPYYGDVRVKYIKQFYEQRTMELGFEDGRTLVLPYSQVMNILCK